VKIAFVTETWLPSTDGVVTRLTATIRELRAAGHDILVIAPKGGEPDFLGATVIGVPSIGFPGIYGGKRWGIPLPRIGRYLREFEPDVVHVVNPLLMSISAVLAARRQRLPLVASYHTDVARYATYYRLGWLQPVIWWVLRQLHGRAAVNLATSRMTCAQLRDHRIDRVSLWRRGVDLDLFRPLAVREPADRPTALYVGRIAAEKGLDRLEPLADPEHKIRLTLVGDGPYRTELARRMAAPTITFTGMLHGHELADTYANADVFVFPSTTDTLGLVLIEALASGLPVIAADSPASRELLRDCPVARLFPPEEADRLPELIRDVLSSGSPASLGARARQEAETWSWSAATEQLLDHYRTAVSGPRPAAVPVLS
jgi:glycosyltransferase involved in cell wall biosynthesis